MGKKSEPVELPRKGVNTRITDKLRRDLEASALSSNRTVGSEIEHRLETSFKFDLVGRSDLGSLKDHPAATHLISSLAGVTADTLRISKDRGFTELQTRIAIRSAIEAASFFHLWDGSEDLPKLLEKLPPGDIKKLDLPPAHLGRAVALDRLNWEGSWSDRPVYDDTLDGRVVNHWTGDGTAVEIGSPKDSTGK